MFAFEARLICKLIKQFVTRSGSLTLPPFHLFHLYLLLLPLLFSLSLPIRPVSADTSCISLHRFNEIPNYLLITSQRRPIKLPSPTREIARKAATRRLKATEIQGVNKVRHPPYRNRLPRRFNKRRIIL